jgi:Tfp pilus assembly protein PilZ
MEQVPQVTVATRVVWERPERPQRNAKHREVVVGVSYGVTEQRAQAVAMCNTNCKRLRHVMHAFATKER